ncbi:MAG TPA: alpha-2-macroglobulin family protein, partial [Dehalococcoidia bacterium]|nr:alpha-2-macroglobulin family protein [Dehalococcoidia bacterium]
EPRLGGKGGGGLEDPRLRQEFRNSAYWEAQLVTDVDGKASVEVKMPDNLTTWRMQVLAVSGDTLVGEATNELVSTQPLLIRPALPRFLRVGDSVVLRALVRNATRTTQEVDVEIDAEGVSLADTSARHVSIAPGASVEVAWPAAVKQEGSARLTITARGEGVDDAVLQELPIYLDVTPETTATGGVVTDEQVTETVYIPSYTLQSEGNGSLEVGVQASLTGSLADGLYDFRPEIWESTERIASRVIATLAASEAEPGATLPFSESSLRGDVATLVSMQRGDGGWPWCRLCLDSNPQVTGWVLQALGAWQDAGHDVSPSSLDRAVEYVNSFVHRFRDVNNPADPNMKAYLLYSLAAAGREASAAPTMRAVLEQDRQNLANWARAYLLLGFARAGLDKDDAEVQMLLNDLAVNVIASANGNHWEDPKIGSLTQTGPRTTALVLQAIATVDAGHPLIEETVRWLVIALNTDVCRTTLERAQAIVALSSFVVMTGERGANFGYAVRLDDRELLGGQLRSTGEVEMESVELPISELTAGRPSTLELARDYRRKGRMYYTLNLRYVTPAADILALNRGFGIAREYSLLDDPETRVTSARLGDVVRVRLTVLLPADRNYVTVED